MQVAFPSNHLKHSVAQMSWCKSTCPSRVTAPTSGPADAARPILSSVAPGGSRAHILQNPP
eukprot:2581242-Amphidinium_carterae.1